MQAPCATAILKYANVWYMAGLAIFTRKLQGPWHKEVCFYLLSSFGDAPYTKKSQAPPPWVVGPVGEGGASAHTSDSSKVLFGGSNLGLACCGHVFGSRSLGIRVRACAAVGVQQHPRAADLLEHRGVHGEVVVRVALVRELGLVLV